MTLRRRSELPERGERVGRTGVHVALPRVCIALRKVTGCFEVKGYESFSMQECLFFLYSDVAYVIRRYRDVDEVEVYGRPHAGFPGNEGLLLRGADARDFMAGYLEYHDSARETAPDCVFDGARHTIAYADVSHLTYRPEKPAVAYTKGVVHESQPACLSIYGKPGTGLEKQGIWLEGDEIERCKTGWLSYRRALGR